MKEIVEQACLYDKIEIGMYHVLKKRRVIAFYIVRIILNVN